MRPVKIFSLIITYLFVVLLTRQTAFAESPDEAMNFYHQGIAAKTIGEREQAFEKALGLYIAQFNEMKQQGQMNGLLCYNIGNCYFNLEHYGEAIYYYQLGSKLLPGDEKITANLSVALAKRSNPIDVETGGLKESLLAFHYKISTAKRIDLLVGAAFLAAISLTWLLLRPNIAARYLSILSVLAVTCLSTSLGMEYYAPQHVGIIIKNADIRKGPGDNFAPITAHPVGEGSSIKVISLSEEWYQVKLNDGRRGFVQQDDLKLLNI